MVLLGEEGTTVLLSKHYHGQAAGEELSQWNGNGHQVLDSPVVWGGVEGSVHCLLLLFSETTRSAKIYPDFLAFISLPGGEMCYWVVGSIIGPWFLV